MDMIISIYTNEKDHVFNMTHAKSHTILDLSKHTNTKDLHTITPICIYGPHTFMVKIQTSSVCFLDRTCLMFNRIKKKHEYYQL